MKECFKCGVEKELDAFYKHPQMADGRVNKCKECSKADVRQNRADKVEYYRAYDRERGNRQTKSYCDEYRRRYPKKASARRKVSYHLRKGNLTRKPCEVCGESETHAHHPDYERALDVMWLCAAHHRQWHDENGEGINGS